MSDVSDSVVHFLSGALGGVVSTAATYPMLNLSTRLQLQRTASSDGTIAALTKALKESSIADLYAGFSSGMLGVAISQGVFYWSYELCKDNWAGVVKRKTFSTAENLVIAAIAGVATAVSVNPIWVVNTRMSVRSKEGGAHHESAVQALIDIVQKEGVLTLFNGVGPALILVANPTIQYMIFEELKTALLNSRKAAGKGLVDLDFFFLGLVSKFFASSITYPLMLVKSRMQAKTEDGHAQYKGTVDAILKIAKTEGIESLFKGYLPKILQSVLTAAILFLAKEKFFKWTVALLVFAQLKKAPKPVSA